MKKRLYLLFSVCCLTFLTFTACTTADNNNSATSDTDKIGDDTIDDDLNDVENGANDVLDDPLDMDGTTGNGTTGNGTTGGGTTGNGTTGGGTTTQ